MLIIMRFSVVLCLAAAAILPAQVKFTPHKTNGAVDAVEVSIDGKPFTTFEYGEKVAKPYLAPVRSASGKIVTRGFPMQEIAGESRDHLHHTGLWFSYDDVNGTKLWENHPSYTKPHMGREVVKSTEYSGNTLKAVIEWRDTDGKLLLTENRDMTFGGDAKTRTIDFRISMTAAQDLTFGDTKEGAFAIRLAEPFTEKKGGRMANAEGQSLMKNVWGKRSNWVDYTGDLDGEKLGVAMFDHPGNPRHPTYWHARDYGLFALNPFGQNAFDDKLEESKWKLAKGEKISFRWDVVVHPADADLAKMYAEWAK
jgi:Family of unknown function (DUF6807)